MRWAGGWTAVQQAAACQAARLLDCETKARQSSRRYSKQQASSEHRPSRCGRIRFVEARLHPRPFWATGVGYQSPYTAHIYIAITQSPSTTRHDWSTTSTIGPKARSSGRRMCAAGTQRHSNCQLASKAASHRRLSHALQNYTLPLGPCTRCTSPIFTPIGLSTVWPDKPRSQLCPWVPCNEKLASSRNQSLVFQLSVPVPTS